ncbi:DUF4252 domain-containing protein [Chryseolinea lacunae]|uniref:DUF4252 domain-containing protein n=1 Tax=Chryseolinea lacunae TaxID=2801331 RepID=A0ABS1KTD6_9BACT|nr:DUF4252 domain-containing protein [Chryseolinea lacunae]MBL0742583.1 DUF4252 domain-containing protein [Chryseolinea lacunae]
MKTLIASFLLVTVLSATAVAQSKSFISFKEKFIGLEDVHHLSLNGFFARTIFKMVAEDDLNHAVKAIKNIRLVTVPKAAFQKQNVSVPGFKNVLHGDAFEELAHVKENGDDITLYMQSTQKNDNRYMVLVEEEYVVTLIEFRGKVDPDFLIKNRPMSYNKS